ncbi:MAG: YigZ family protein [Paracoccaceae bacterium]|jgi:putative IMPACT (imprinted ancient) family translation regulator|nr:YigZ family protein [Paracoccaceae bacterium]
MGTPDLNQITHVLTDRGSKYAVSGATAFSRADVDAILKTLKKNKRFAKATHNTWAVVLSDGGPLKGDDGESGAGMVILNMLEHSGITDHIIVVTRWYGGVKLGGDRFRRVKDCVHGYLDEFFKR